MEFDEILESIGAFGYYQRVQLFFLCFKQMPMVFANMGYVFWRPFLSTGVSWQSLTMELDTGGEEGDVHSYGGEGRADGVQSLPHVW